LTMTIRVVSMSPGNSLILHPSLTSLFIQLFEHLSDDLSHTLQRLDVIF
jgi:hypothetical protein